MQSRDCLVVLCSCNSAPL